MTPGARLRVPSRVVRDSEADTARARLRLAMRGDSRLQKVRVRLDQLVVEKGLAPSRERARALILAGPVSVDGQPQAKAGPPIDPSAEVALLAPDHPYVGRGGLKLAHALDEFRIAVEG